YLENSPEERMRSALNYATIGLVRDTMLTAEDIYYTYRDEFTVSILSALKEAEKAFGEHPYRYVLRGRQKILVQFLSGKEPLFQTKEDLRFYQKEALERIRRNTKGKGYKIPAQYQELVSQPINAWEHYAISYTRLEEIPIDRQECVPPEYREEHKKVARK
ncbi:MAG: hypothetical protein AABY00_00860, partial [Nanoarchaeota archaeon]